jgi:transposase-like protein
LLGKKQMGSTDRRRSKAEMFPIVEAWQESGLSKKAFCERHGVEKSVFMYWWKKYREVNEPGGFIPLTVGSSHSPSQDHLMEIQYPNGVVLKLSAHTPASLVRQYIGL